MCWHTLAPWDVNRSMREKLKEASRRYAAKLGTAVTEPGLEEPRVQLAWDDNDAVAFVQDKTGYDVSLCRMWLVYEWDIDVPTS
jgi:hypothetical protein